MNTTNELLSVIQDRIIEVGQSLSAGTGGRSLCQLHKDGTVTGGTKYDEGRYAALRRIRRFVESSVDREISPELLDPLQQEAEDWRRMLQTYQEKSDPPMQWIAYAQGGVDAIESLLTVLEG
jgi:hypothetical protein